jgi:hypothetical protein
MHAPPLPALLSIAVLTLAGWLVPGCAASAQFHSKTGKEFTPIVAQAVRCDEAEVGTVIAAGGILIGTIDARALAVRATDDDVADKAAKVAAENGGTHLVLTERDVESFTYTQPGHEDTECREVNGARDCRTTVTAPTQTTVDKPTAKFVVLRVPRQNWPQLPTTLRPVGIDE